MWPKAINTATACFAENRKAGIMICGINWGGSPEEESTEEKESFFSDSSVNSYPYRNRLLVWFELFGHPLSTKPENAGVFEKSIIQTNWLNNQSPNMNGKSLYTECVNQWANFEYHLSTLEPKIIVFLSVSLLDTLNSQACIKNATKTLGEACKPDYFQKDIYHGEKKLKRFRVGIQKFSKTTIIALPHPTGSRGLSNDYISAFKPEINPIFEAFKNENRITA